MIVISKNQYKTEAFQKHIDHLCRRYGVFMRLSNIQNLISSIKYDSFPEYFMHYIMQVQDKNIDLELKHLISRNQLNVNSMIQLVNYTVSGGDKL